MNYTNLLATRTNTMNASAVREILKVVSQPGMISLAGGIPAPESFPLDLMSALTETVLDKHGAGALQYDVTEGFAPLRSALVGYLATKEIDVTEENILVFSGSQSILDTVAKILISPGDAIAVESPTYLGALSAFNAYEPRYVDLQADDDGLVPESLDDMLTQHTVKFVYLTPTFQNPTGRTLSLERRHQVADIIKRHDALVLEDDPYGDLRYRGEFVPPIKSLAPDNVIYASTFSKIFAPGLRLGFCAVPQPLMQWLTIAKQGADLHTSTFNQALAAEYLAGGYLGEHLPKIISIYKPRQEAMLSALDKHMPDSFAWTRPDGGMFLWVEGPADFDMHTLYERSVANSVAFVPGKYFFAQEGAGEATMRLNFTMQTEDVIEQAIRTIAEHAA